MTLNLQIHEDLREQIILKDNGKYKLVLGVKNTDKVATCVYNNSLIFEEILLDETLSHYRSLIYELLTFILYTSKNHLKIMSIPYHEFPTNCHLGTCINMMNFNFLTYLDIYIETLNMNVATTLYQRCKIGNITFLGVNPNRIMDNANCCLIADVLSLPNITGIAVYRKLFRSIDDINIIFGFLNTNLSKIVHLKIELDKSWNVHDITYLNSEVDRKIFSTFVEFISKSNIKTLELTREWLLKDLFKSQNNFLNVIANNITITRLHLSRRYENALEILEFLYDRNYTITDLKLENFERKRSLRLKKTNQLMDDFLTRNRDLTKKYKTLFEIMLSEIDLNNTEKRQRVY